MINLENWEREIQAGLEALRQQQTELVVRIHRQEGALLLAQELIRAQAEEAPAATPPNADQ